MGEECQRGWGLRGIAHRPRAHAYACPGWRQQQPSSATLTPPHTPAPASPTMQLLLAKKGSLGKVWLAAHWEKKLNKQTILQTDIKSTVGACSGEAAAAHPRRLPRTPLPVARAWPRLMHRRGPPPPSPSTSILSPFLSLLRASQEASHTPISTRVGPPAAGLVAHLRQEGCVPCG